MVDRLTWTILSILVVLGAYWLYALFVVPRIDPEDSQVPGAGYELSELADAAKPTDRFRHVLEPLFPADSWERDRAIVLKNDENTFMLIVGDYETLNDGLQLRLKPCTIVLNPEAAQDDAKAGSGGCIILTAPDGAELDFDRPFEITNGRIGRLLGGRFVGEVSIRSHVPHDELGRMPAGHLEIVTRNVQMNAQQIWTPHAVQFRYGQNVGAGRDLMINLTEIESADMRRLPSDNPTHLRSLELVHLDHLTVSTATTSSSATMSPQDPTKLAVRCQGPLVFDFVGGSVTLNDQVAIQRIDDNAHQPPIDASSGNVSRQSDWITCDLLVMHFRPQERDEALERQDAPANRPQPSWELPEFELSQIVAFGSPAIVEAPTYKMHAEAEKIELHLSHNRLLLQDAEQALLQYDTHAFHAARMYYYADPQGGPGRAEIEGRGQYVGTMKDDVVHLHWQDSLKFGPEDGLYLFEVDGEAHIRWGKNAAQPVAKQPPVPGQDRSPALARHSLTHQLAARRLSVWLRNARPIDQTGFRPLAHREELGVSLGPPQTSDQAAFTGTVASDRQPPQKQPDSTPEVVTGAAGGWTPDRIVARGNVRLRTPQIAGDVEFAEIQLDDTPDAVSANDDGTMTGPALGPPLGREPAMPTERFLLTGHDIHVELQNVADGTPPRLKSVTIKGGVHLRQATEDPDLASLEIKGAIVELRQASESGAEGRITGEPATVKSRGVELTGRDIRVDQSRNRIWIDEAGSAFLPLPQSVAVRLSRRTATMQIAWQGRMVFDGESVVCEKGVEIRGPAQIATADALQATLVRPIQLDSLGTRAFLQADPARDDAEDSYRQNPSRENPSRQNPSRQNPSRQNPSRQNPSQVLSRVSLTGNVWVESRNFDEQGLASIDEFQMPSLTYDQTTGQLVGAGPGWISSVRYTKRPGSANSRQPQNVPADAAQLTHTLIEFQKQLNGSLTKREVSVHDRVRAIHGPIQDWKERIRFEDPRRSPETITMRAMRLTVAQMPSGNGQPSLEFAASGNTQIEGGTFVASAQHVRYAQAKDMLVMEGDGRSVARLSYQRRIGAPRNDAAARKIQYWIGENRANIEGVVFGDVTNPVANQDPNRRPPPPNTPTTRSLLPQQGRIFGRYPQPSQTSP